MHHKLCIVVSFSNNIKIYRWYISSKSASSPRVSDKDNRVDAVLQPERYMYKQIDALHQCKRYMRRKKLPPSWMRLFSKVPNSSMKNQKQYVGQNERINCEKECVKDNGCRLRSTQTELCQEAKVQSMLCRKNRLASHAKSHIN